MTIPANLQQALAPWGAEAVYVCFGTEGGPYTGCSAANPLPVSAVQSGTWTVTIGSISQLPAALGQTTMANSLPVVIASNQTAFPVSQSGSNWTINNVQLNGTTVDTNSGNSSAGTQRVVLATDQPALTNAQPVNLKAAATGGATGAMTRNVNATKTLVKGSAGTLYGVKLINTSGAAAWIQFFDAATTAAVTLGTTVPIYELNPANNAVQNDQFPAMGIAFTSGLVMASTTAEMGTVGSANGVHITPLYL